LDKDALIDKLGPSALAQPTRALQPEAIQHIIGLAIKTRELMLALASGWLHLVPE
jgi:hypothetical protein